MEEIIFNKNLSVDKVKQMNAQILAFVGDAVHSLYVRERLVLENVCKINKLQQQMSLRVKAKAQSETLELVWDSLSDDEKDIARRARNTHTNNIAKNSSMVEYKRSTAFEAVLGFLYLTGNVEKLTSLLKINFDGLVGDEK